MDDNNTQWIDILREAEVKFLTQIATHMQQMLPQASGGGITSLRVVHIEGTPHGTVTFDIGSYEFEMTRLGEEVVLAGNRHFDLVHGLHGSPKNTAWVFVGKIVAKWKEMHPGSLRSCPAPAA